LFPPSPFALDIFSYFDLSDEGSSVGLPETPEFVNIERFRDHTPGCRQVVHLNNAGASLSPEPVLSAVLEHLSLESRLGGYEAEQAKAVELEAVYTSLADLIGAGAQEIALTQNATRAWDMVFYAIPLGPGDRILTCQAEYASNYIAFLQRSRATGAEIVVVENDSQGALCLDHLATLLDERVKLVAINHMPTNSGLVQPAAQVGKLLEDHPALYLLDACQSVGQMPICVKELKCDVLSATSRKFLRGPRGLGFLFVKQELIEGIEPPFLDLHAATWTHPDRYKIRADARRFETYETFVAGRLGLGAAADYAMEVGLADSWRRVRQLAALARQRLAELGADVHDLGQTQGAIVTFTVPWAAPGRVAQLLRDQGINVWTCTANSARLDMEARGLDQVVRVSPHYYNTEAEIEFLAGTLKRCQG
jgi:selenocysteine lyase/cysteine desulfurase